MPAGAWHEKAVRFGFLNFIRYPELYAGERYRLDWSCYAKSVLAEAFLLDQKKRLAKYVDVTYIRVVQVLKKSPKVATAQAYTSLIFL